MAHSPSDDDDGAASQTAEPQRLPSGFTHSSGSPLNGQSIANFDPIDSLVCALVF